MVGATLREMPAALNQRKGKIQSLGCNISKIISKSDGLSQMMLSLHDGVSFGCSYKKRSVCLFIIIIWAILVDAFIDDIMQVCCYNNVLLGNSLQTTVRHYPDGWGQT